MYIEKETQSAKCAFFAKNDIERRVKIAIKRHPKLISCPQHQATIDQVYNLLRFHAQYSDYKPHITPRYATSRTPANTEVKFDKMSNRMYKKDQLYAKIDQLKCKIVYKKPNNNSNNNFTSYSVHVPLV